jgi:hypothetical protein
MKILINFPDPSKSFTYGVEFGRLLEKIERGDEVIKNNGFPVKVWLHKLMINPFPVITQLIV